MKTITYTKMRDELADVLDALRNGESVTVTQRGRPDVVIEATRKPFVVSRSSGFFPTINDNNQVVKIGNAIIGQTVGQIIEAEQKRQKLTFEQAKDITRTKHAGILKALEDK